MEKVRKSRSVIHQFGWEELKRWRWEIPPVGDGDTG